MRRAEDARHGGVGVPAQLAGGAGAVEDAWPLRVTAAVDRAAGRWEGLVDRVRRLGGAAATYPAASLDSRLLHGALLAAMGPTEEAVDRLVDVIAVAERVGAVRPPC